MLFYIVVICTNNSAFGITSDEDTQYRVGFSAGIGLSTITGLDAVNLYGLPNASEYSVKGFSSSYKPMWDFGVSFQHEKIDKYFIQGNFVLINNIGAKINGVRSGSDKIHSIDITGGGFEGYFGKKIKLNNKIQLIAGIGPSFFLASGKYGGSDRIVYYDVEYYDEELGKYYYEKKSFLMDDGIRVNHFTLGVNAMLGLDIGNLQIALIGNQCLTQTFQKSNLDSKSRFFKLSFTYFMF